MSKLHLALVIIGVGFTLALITMAFVTRSIAYALPGGYWAGVWMRTWQYRATGN